MDLLDYDSTSMNSTETPTLPASRMNRLMKWPLLGGILGLIAMARMASAADAIYENDAIINYPDNVSFPPVIDATNFVNTGSFIINFTRSSSAQPFYETTDTLNYTNTGLMTCSSGFQFDNLSSVTGLRTMSAAFNNSGTINCDPGAGQCLVTATNVVVGGALNVGTGGKIMVSGQNVNLVRSTLKVEGNGPNGISGSASGTGIINLNTNNWVPVQELGDTFANSAPLPAPINSLRLNNSTAYETDSNFGNTNIIVRAVFVENSGDPDVSYNVYFDTATADGAGSATIEWGGTFQDLATGGVVPNFLDLKVDFQMILTTNLVITATGLPSNYTFTESSRSQAGGATPESPAPPGFVNNVFLPGSVTNIYSYANAQMITTSVGTNTIPNHAITNLPARIEIAAGSHLDMSLAEISGANYLSVTATNQFDGSAGAGIQVPYSDINVGVTNGFLTMSNTITSVIPVWSGGIQAWSTRWIAPLGQNATIDYRVLIVGSQLSPSSFAQVQDLIMHSTNSIVISDNYNILRKLNADAQNLTLTTNGIGIGSTSAEGELNVLSPAIFFGSSLPNLRNLTNNGAIRFQNLAEFDGRTNTVTVIAGSPATVSAGMLSEVNQLKNVLKNDKVFIGTNIYTFVGTLTNKIPNLVKIGANFDASMGNLIAAINRSSGAGTTYSTNTSANPVASAGLLSNHSFQVMARAVGASGNLISTTLSPSATNLTWNGHSTLVGGADAVAASTNTSSVTVPYLNYINNGVVSDQGSTIWSANFVNTGNINNGSNSFSLNSLTTTLLNGAIVAGGDITFSADSVFASNAVINAGKSLVLSPTNLLTDAGVSSSNIWTIGGAAGVGFNLLTKPAMGDLLGTIVTNMAPTNKNVVNTWAARDLGAVASGFTNNAAIGWLALDGMGTDGHTAQFTFNGSGVSNALYVDCLQLLDAAAVRDNAGNLSNLAFNTNIVIYYAQALIDGVSVAEKLNHKNNDHLRWVPTYAGNFSSVSLVYPDGSTNIFNAALATSPNIDSNGNGIPNAADPSPFFVPSQINLTMTVTNSLLQIQWNTIPLATNYVFISTNMYGDWQPFTNFNRFYYGAGAFSTNLVAPNAFVSPQLYPSSVTNVWIYDTISTNSHYYRVEVHPWLTYPN
jgi:hypothetical protein